MDIDWISEKSSIKCAKILKKPLRMQVDPKTAQKIKPDEHAAVEIDSEDEPGLTRLIRK